MPRVHSTGLRGRRNQSSRPCHLATRGQKTPLLALIVHTANRSNLPHVNNIPTTRAILAWQESCWVQCYHSTWVLSQLPPKAPGEQHSDPRGGARAWSSTSGCSHWKNLPLSSLYLSEKHSKSTSPRLNLTCCPDLTLALGTQYCGKREGEAVSGPQQPPPLT